MKILRLLPFSGKLSYSVFLGVFCCSLNVVAQTVWDNSAGDFLWSNNLNWSTNASPAGQNVLFNNAALTSSTVDAGLQENFSISSLSFQQNSVTPHVLTIQSGETLSITGTASGARAFDMGAAASGTTNVTMTGGGSLKINNAISNNNDFSMYSTNTSVSTFVLDMSGLSSFDATVRNFFVGTGTSTGGSPNFTITFAQENTVTANLMRFGGAGGTSGTGFVNQVLLGQDTTFNSNTIVVGSGRNSVDMGWDSGLVGTPTFKIRATNGTGRADLVFGNKSTSYSGVSTGSTSIEVNADFTGGSLDWHLNDLVVGISETVDGANGVGYARSVLSIDGGDVDATNVYIARTKNITATPTTNEGAFRDANHGTLNMEGGTLTAGTLSIAHNEDSSQGVDAKANGIFNISGGNLIVEGDLMVASHTFVPDGVYDVSAGESRGQLNITGGNVQVGGNLTESVAGNNLSSVLLNGSAAVLNLTRGYINVDTFDVRQGTLRNVSEIFDGDLGVIALTKTGANILTLGGKNNYTGGTNVDAGTLRIGEGALYDVMGSGDVALASGTTLEFARIGKAFVANDITGAGSLVQNGQGRTVLSGNNTFTSVTVNNGILEATNAASLGTVDVQVNNGGALYYLGNGALGLTQNINLASGSAVGATLEGYISTTGTATTSGTIDIHLHQLTGQTPSAGIKTLLAAGSGLDDASYRLLLFNFTDYTASAPTVTDSAVTANVASTAAADLLVWQGGNVLGYENVWSVADAAGFSNWVDINGSPSAVVPGANTHVLVQSNAADMSLHADMSIASIQFGPSNNGLDLTLRDKSFDLTLGAYDLEPEPSTKYTIKMLGLENLLIDINRLVLTDAESIINVDNALGEVMEIRAIVDGNGFTKRGDGVLKLTGDRDNVNSGTTTNVEGGVLELGKTDGAIAIAGDLRISSFSGTGTDSSGDPIIINTAGTVVLLANEQIADTAGVEIDAGRSLQLGAFAETIDRLTGLGTVTGTNALSVGGGNGSSEFDGSITGSLSFSKVGTGTFKLNKAQTYTGTTNVREGVLQYGVNNAIGTGELNVDGGTLDMNGFSDTVGETTLDNNGKIIGAGSILTSNSTRQFRSGEVGVILAGNGGINKTTSGLVILSGDNTYRGGTTVGDGILRLTNNSALGALNGATTINGGSTTGRIELANNITVGERLVMGARQGVGFVDAAALSNLSGTNTWAGNIEFTTGGSTYNFESQAGLFVITGNLTGRTETTNARQLQFFGAGDGLITGIIANGPGSGANYSFRKLGTGTWTLAAANTFTGLTEVSAGTLRLTNGKALQNSSAVVVSNNANISYQSGVANSDLTIASLALQGNHRIGVELGNEIASTGAATTLAGSNIVLDVHGISGQNYLTGSYDVITGGAGSTLNNANYTLGNLFNLTNFSVDGIGKDADSVFLNITAVTAPTGPFYWKGGYGNGMGHVWAVTNGLTTGGKSNWTLDAAGTVDTPLIPGATADVIFSATGAANEATPMTLGSNMGVNSLTFNTASNVNLQDVTNTLTLYGSNAININPSAGEVILNTNFIFNHGSAFINIASGEVLGIGAIQGVNGFTKVGDGTLRFVQGGSSQGTGTVVLQSGLNLFERGDGAVAVSGDLEIGTDSTTAIVRLLSMEQIGDTADVLVSDGSLLDLNGQTESFGSLSGSGSIVTSGDDITELSVGGGTNSATFTGSLDETTGLLSLAKRGTGTQTFTQALRYSGTTEVLNGTLRLVSGASIGVASGSAGSLRIGVGGGSSSSYAKLVVEAGAELRVGTGVDSTFEVGRGDVNIDGVQAGGYGELDLSASSQFTANVGRFLIGVEGDGTISQNPSLGRVKLATNNDIIAATEFTLGYSPNAGTSGTSELTFGAGVTNVTTPVMTLGGRKSSANVFIETGGRVNISSGAIDPEAYSDLFIGYNNVGTGYNTVTVVDMRPGTFTATLDELVVGYKSGGNVGSSDGQFYLGASSENDVRANSVMIGFLNSAPTDVSRDTKGLLRIEGGSLSVVESIILGSYSGSHGKVEGRLEILGGTVSMVSAGDITTSADPLDNSDAIVQLNGGTLDMVGGKINVDQLIAQSGVIANLGEVYNGSGMVVENITNLEKTTTGTLRLQGNNSYTGGTRVNQGSFLVNGTHTFAGSYEVANGATLGGTGKIETAVNNSITIKTGGILSVGDNASEVGSLEIVTSGTGALVFEDNSFLDFDITGGGGHGELYDDDFSDQLRITGTVDVGEGVKLRVTAADMMNWVEGDTWKLFDWDWVTAPPQGGYDFEFISPFDNLTWDLSHLYTDGIIRLAVIPEPTKAILLLFGIAALVTRRNRNHWRNSAA